MVDTVNHLDVEYGQRFFARVFTDSDEAKLISQEMAEIGLNAQPERTHLFNLFSPDSLKPITVSITPFSSHDLSHEGGLSMSQGGHAQGVVVDMQGTEIVSFTHFAVTDGKVVSTRHPISELAGDGKPGNLDEDHIRRFAENTGKVKSAKPLIEVQPRQVRSLASVSYNALLSDPFSRTVHSDREIAALRGNSNIVAEIGLFVLFRTQGSSCCSCSCSCWGSSSCSSSAV